jgi:hypothetical protein
MAMKYPSFVDVENIKEEPANSAEYRYVLKIPFADCKDKPAVVVVLKNPSKATKNKCDVTISKVCNVAYNSHYGMVIVHNLFPFRSTKPEYVFSNFIKHENVYKKRMKVNIRWLSKSIVEVDDVIFAWGTNTIKHRTNKQYKEAKDEVKKVCINSNKKKNLKMVAGGKKEPLHGQRWSNKSELVEYKE